jgi:hypothetical protein
MKTSGFMHSINATETPKNLPLPAILIVCILTIILGGVGGFMMVKKSSIPTSAQKGTVVQTDKSAGVVDKKTFKDSAEGILKEGGMEGEGNFHLERPGGTSQNAYLTSSTVDLGKYVGKKVKVWGQTFTGQKAGWLMDVGLVEIQ